ncbi:hypothetical protein SO802_018480, partial [Lithocarpus litseifolius]
MLVSLGFHTDIVELILSCISITFASLLFNGSQLGEIYPSHGLRQGDSISPYIFILCMEFLSTLINMKCEEGSWKKIKASRSGLGFSHIIFADDLLLFAKTNQSNIEAIVEVLDEFCKLTGPKISKEKSKIFFSPNFTAEEKVEIVNQTGLVKHATSGNILDFQSSTKGGDVMNSNLLCKESKPNWLVGKLNVSPRRGEWCSLRHRSPQSLNIQCNAAKFLSRFV